MTDEENAAVQTTSDMLVLSAGINRVPVGTFVVALLYTWIRAARVSCDGYTIEDARHDLDTVWNSFEESPAAFTSPGGEA